jgi:hypothetical protein
MTEAKSIDTFGRDLVQALILAHTCDPGSAFYHNCFPRDIISCLVQQFVPSVDGYLIPRPLARSYYQICFERCAEPEEISAEPIVSLVSIERYEPIPLNPWVSAVPSTTSLIEIAARVLKFLDKVRREVNLKAYSQQQLADLFDEYALFLLLWKKHVSTAKGALPPLVPSLRLQAVWFSHVLQSAAYEQCTQQYIRPTRLSFLDSECDFSHCLWLDSDAYARQESLTQSLWQATYGSKTFPIHLSPQHVPGFDVCKQHLLESFTPAMLVDDQDWLMEFELFTRGTDVFDVKFLEQAHLGMISLRCESFHFPFSPV